MYFSFVFSPISLQQTVCSWNKQFGHPNLDSISGSGHIRGPRVLYTWNRCQGSNTRSGHTNKFAVTSLCQMTNSGGDEDVLCNLDGMTVALTIHRGMSRFRDLVCMSNVCGSARQLLKSRGTVFRHFSTLPCSSELELPGQNTSYTDEWKDLWCYMKQEMICDWRLLPLSNCDLLYEGCVQTSIITMSKRISLGASLWPSG